MTDVALEEANEEPGVDEYDVKQVILIRRDLGMRRGKEIAQGSHASMAFLSEAVQDYAKQCDDYLLTRMEEPQLELSNAAWRWIEGRFTKVTLQVWSEEELEKYYQAALAAGLTAHLITDSGKTEFRGEATKTCCAIGPDYSDKINAVTGDLRLY